MQPVKSHWYQYRLLIAIAISLLLHALIIGKTTFNLAPPNPTGTLQITLSTQNNAAPSIQTSRQELIPDKEIAAEKSKNLENIKLESPDTSINVPRQTTDTGISNNTTAQTSSQYLTPQKTAMEYESMPPVNSINPASRVDIQFNVYDNTNPRPIASISNHFELSDTNNYQIRVSPAPNSESEPQLDFFIEINGRVFRKNLGPAIYLSRGDLASKLLSLNQLKASRPTNGRMPDNILDQQSMIYFHMFFPPSNADTEFILTDGQAINTYTVKNMGMTILSNPGFGKVRVVKLVALNNANEEKFELWLSPDYRYLPLKVKHTDINGEVIEQLAVAINIQ